MAKLKTFKFIPKPNGFIKRQRKYHTIYLQNPVTGEMEGREEVKGIGDRTGVLRVKKPFKVLVKRSKRARGHIRKYKAGEIVGRFMQ